MRLPLLLFYLVLTAGSTFGQMSFFKAKIVSKGEKILKIKFYAYNSQNDFVLHNVSKDGEVYDNWETSGKIDGRIVQKKKNDDTIWTIELEQEVLYIKPVEEKYAMQYNWGIEVPGDTFLVKFPPITRGQLKDNFQTKIHRRYQIKGNIDEGLMAAEGAEEVLNCTQIKSNALDLRISELNPGKDCSAACQLAVAFISILEMNKRGLKRK